MKCEAETIIRELDKKKATGKNSLTPGWPTFAALRRLKAGKGVRRTLEDHLKKMADIAPECREVVFRCLERIRDIWAQVTAMRDETEINERTANRCPLDREIVEDKVYQSKLRVAVKRLHLTAIEIEYYAFNLAVIMLGGLPRRRFRDHSLDRKGSKDLKGYRSFMLRDDPLYKKHRDPAKSKAIICLYTSNAAMMEGELNLCGLGRQDKIFKTGSRDMSSSRKVYVGIEGEVHVVSEENGQLLAEAGYKVSPPIDVLEKRFRPSTIRGIKQMLAGQAATVIDSDEALDEWLDKMHRPGKANKNQAEKETKNK